MKKLTYFVVAVAFVMLWAGCSEETRARYQRASEPEVRAAEPTPQPKAEPKPVQSKGDHHVIRLYDCSCCAAVKLEKLMPEMVQLNQPFQYTITATNQTDMVLHDVVVKENLPAGFKHQRSSPAGKLEDGTLTWALDMLGPKASERITVQGVAERAGTIQTCADVTYIIPACAQTQVVQPALSIVKKAPEHVIICEPIPFEFTVTNTGTGTAANVKVTDQLPDGLKTADGRNAIDLTLGSLAPGQSVSRIVNVRAEKTGTFQNKATAAADGDLKAESAETRTKVTRPVLTLEKGGPELEFLGRSVAYEIIVANTGDAPAAETVVTDTIPANVEDIRVNGNGRVAAGRVTWDLGTLPPDTQRRLTVSYRPTQPGSYRNEARVTAVCTEAVASALATQVEGIPAVLLEMIDINDPVPIGGNEVYIITVTNQGTAVDTNIRITGYLEEEMEFVSSSGATRGTHQGGVVTFEPLSRLAPEAKAEWRVEVKAVAAGDIRFRVEMETDKLNRNVIKTEATRFYE